MMFDTTSGRSKSLYAIENTVTSTATFRTPIVAKLNSFATIVRLCHAAAIWLKFYQQTENGLWQLLRPNHPSARRRADLVAAAPMLTASALWAQTHPALAQPASAINGAIDGRSIFEADPRLGAPNLHAQSQQ